MQIPGYDDLVLIAHGGFATVYRARQVAFEREVAVKVLTIELDEERDRARFHREVAAMGRLTGHPHIVTILDSGFTPDGRPYLTTPYYPQGSLGQQLAAAGPFAVREVLAVGVAMAGALDAAHRRGILHRDIKPENILLSRYGEVALTDFGIATDVGPVDGRDGPTTHTTQAFTLGHAAPEVLEHGRATEASDVYSLASSLWMLLTGRSPFGGTPDEGIIPRMLRVKTAPVPPIGRDDVPASFERVLQRAMAKDPADRLVPAEAFGRALQDIQRELDLPVTQLRTESVVDLRDAIDRTPPGGVPRPLAAPGAAGPVGAPGPSSGAGVLDGPSVGAVTSRAFGPPGGASSDLPVGSPDGTPVGSVGSADGSADPSVVAVGASGSSARRDGGTAAGGAAAVAGAAAAGRAAGAADVAGPPAPAASEPDGGTTAAVTPVVLGGQDAASDAAAGTTAPAGPSTPTTTGATAGATAAATGRAQVPRWQGSHTQAAITGPGRLAEPVWRDDASVAGDVTAFHSTGVVEPTQARGGDPTTTMPTVDRIDPVGPVDPGGAARGGRPARYGEVPPRGRRGRPVPPPPPRRRKVLPVLLVLLVIIGAFGIGYLTMRGRSSLTTTDAGPTTTATTVPPTTTVTTTASTAPTTVAPTTISTPTGPPSTAAATTAPPTTAPPTTAKPAPRPVGALIAPADLPADVAQAADVAQRAATALAVGDWNTARALVPSLRKSDNKELASAWRGLVQATIVVIDAKPTDGGAVLRLGEVAHELVGDAKRTSLYCVTWSVKGGNVIGMSDQQIIPPTPWRDGEWTDPGEAAATLTAQCRKL